MGEDLTEEESESCVQILVHVVNNGRLGYDID